MFIYITKENINELDNSFISKKFVLDEINNNPFGKFLIYKDDNILGYIYYSDIYERIEINQFEVYPKKRNCGIGSKLLGKLIKSSGKDITLEVREDNIIALKLYNKFNFKKVAIRRCYYEDIDGILMERKIKETL